MYILHKNDPRRKYRIVYKQTDTDLMMMLLNVETDMIIGASERKATLVDDKDGNANIPIAAVQWMVRASGVADEWLITSDRGEIVWEFSENKIEWEVEKEDE